MGGKVIDITSSLKRAKRKKWMNDQVSKVKTWCRNNPELATTIAVTVLGLAAAGAKALVAEKRKHDRLEIVEEEERVKEEYVYDRSLGHYWELDHKLTNDEWVEIERRKREGETLADILLDMDVLA